MKKIQLFLLLFIFTLPLHADPFKTAKAALKSKNNLEAAETELLNFAADKATPPSERARAYDMAAQLAHKIYTVENEKLYLKQKFDTLRFFNAIQRLYRYTASCDSVESLPDEKGRVRREYGKSNREDRLRLRTGLLQGGKWMMQRRRYADAARFFHTYSATDSDLIATDTLRNQIALWTTKCAYAAKDMHLTLRYADRAIATGQDVAHSREYKARALLATGDTASWEKELRKGMEATPRHSYFYKTSYTRMLRKNNLDAALYWTKRMIKSCPDSAYLRQALAHTYYIRGDLDNCIVTAEDQLTRTPDDYKSLYYVGSSWLIKAEDFEKSMSTDAKSVQFRDQRRQLTQMYQNARRPLEAYRRLRPDDVSVWASMLYKIYFSLNMGKELDEVERLMKN
ncbi:MAG: hypothetical protein HUK04_01260 [Bacteroidaceae bacterium]|nr:hypothetical protein [Bacteroidaceae bacterium]